jgi:hypothetical protein
LSFDGHPGAGHASVDHSWGEKTFGAQEWQRALFEPDPVLRAQRIAELLASLTADLAPSVAGIFEQAQESGIRFGDEHRLFLRAWGKLDGVQAMERAVGQTGGVKNTPELLAALAGWASMSPNDARAWVEALEEGRAREAIVYGLLDGWATVDFQSAADYAESRPRSSARDKRFRELLLQRALASGGIAAAQQWVRGISDDEHNLSYKQRAFDEVIQTMLYRDPSAAAHWIAENAGRRSWCKSGLRWNKPGPRCARSRQSLNANCRKRAPS